MRKFERKHKKKEEINKIQRNDECARCRNLSEKHGPLSLLTYIFFLYERNEEGQNQSGFFWHILSIC